MSETSNPRARGQVVATLLAVLPFGLIAAGCDSDTRASSATSPPPAVVEPTDLPPPPVPTRPPTTTSASPKPHASAADSTPRSAVPDVLVGEWDGGGGPNADYIFTAEGYVGVIYGNGRAEDGTVVV